MDESAPDPVRRTLTVWRPRTSRRLTEEDAREIVENVSGFFRMLQEWEAGEAGKERRADGEPQIGEDPDPPARRGDSI